MWLLEVVYEFFAAVSRGDKSWWPFVLSVAGITVIAVILYMGLA